MQPSSRPSCQPTEQPTSTPSSIPTSAPSPHPTKSYAPIVKDIRTISIEETEVTVDVTLDKYGEVACGIFSNKDQPKYVSSVFIQGFKGTTSIAGNNVTLTLGGLIPASIYSIYCATTSYDSVIMDITEVLKKTITIETLCCKSADIKVSVNALSLDMSASGVPNAFSLNLQALPQKNVTYSVSLSLIGSKGNLLYSNIPVLPPFVTVTSLTSLSSSPFSLSSTVISLASNATKMMINVTTTGPSADEYRVLFPLGNVINIITGDSQPVAPQLLSAIFASNGQSIIVQFDSATDQGAISDTLFDCSRLLNFLMANRTQCTWNDQSSVTAFLNPSSVINVGDMVSLKARSLKAKCLTPRRGCAFYNYTIPVTQVIIEKPIVMLLPSVVITGPEIISTCNSLKVDLSYSTGAYGRNWKSWQFEVLDMNNQSVDLSTVSQYLDDYFSISPPITLPFGMLDIGTYKISVTLTNFLDVSNKGSYYLRVINLAVPIVTIAGTQLRTVNRRDSLKLRSNAYIIDCTNSSAKDSLVYEWTISSNENILNFKNQASSKSSFILDPWTLDVDGLYTVALTVSSRNVNTSSSASVQIYVEQSDIFAAISGGSQQNIKVDGTLKLDASGSFDNDIENIGASNLFYTWTCMTTAPVLTNTCEGLQWLTRQNVSVVEIKALKTTSTSSVFVISVTVYDSKRSDKASVTIGVLGQSNPIAIISSSFPTKVNPSSKIVVNAYIENIVSSVNATWTAVSSAGYDIDISSYALSPLSLATNLTTSSIAFNLILSPNALYNQQLQTVSFKLITGKAVAAIDIEVNGNPVPGVFEVTPSSGIELETKFLLSASGWNDADLPLLFSFGYYSSGNSNTANSLTAASTVSYTSSNLPAGLVSGRNETTCFLSVFDSLGATATAKKAVIVKKLVITDAALNSLVSSKLSDALSSPDLDATRQVLAVVASIINTVDCSGANSTFCSTMNRNYCTTVANTCGECLSGFVSSAKVGNKLCSRLVKPRKKPTLSPSQPSQQPSRSPTKSPSRAPTKKPSFSPTSSTKAPTIAPTVKLFSNDVVIYNSVEIGDEEQQECSNNCNNNGKCIFQSRSSGKNVTSCGLYDPTCQAVCVCDTGYSGSLCSYDTSSLLLKQGTRYQLLNAYSTLVSSSDMDKSSLVSLSANLVTLTANIDEINLDAVKKASASANILLDSALKLSIAYTDITTLLNALDIIETVALLNNGTYVKDLNVPLTGYKTMKTFGTLLVQQQGLGESEFSEVLNSLRLKGEAVPITDTKLIITPALSDLEAIVEVGTSSITMSVGNNVMDLNVATGVINGRTYGQGYISDAIALIIDDTNKCSSSACQFLLKLKNYDSKHYVNEDIDVESISNITVCDKGISKTVVYNCGDGSNRTVSCNGTFVGYIKSTCPYAASKPSCNLLLGSSLLSKPYNGLHDQCQLQSYDSVSTTCLCNISSTLSSGRRLSSSSSLGSYHFIASETYYVNYPELDYNNKATPSPTMPGYTTVLTVQQTFIGLDVRDFDNPTSLAKNGNIIKLSLAAAIGFQLTKDSIVILSVSSGLKRNRQLLAASSTFIYTITTANTDANNLKTKLDQVVNDGSLAKYLYEVATSAGFVGYSDFYAVSPQLAVYIDAPTRSPTSGPEVFTTNLTRNALIIAFIGFFIVSFMIYMAYRRHAAHKEKERQKKTKGLSESTSDFTNSWLWFLNRNSKKHNELKLHNLSNLGESKEEVNDDKYLNILDSLQNPVDVKKYYSDFNADNANDNDEGNGYLEFWSNYVTKPIVDNTSAGGNLLMNIPQQISNIIPISAVPDSQVITVQREGSSSSASGWMTSDSESDDEMAKNRSFDFQQGTLDDWMASYEKFNNDSKRSAHNSIDDWLGITRAKPRKDAKKNAIVAKDALMNDWLNEPSNKAGTITKPRKSVYSGASYGRKEVAQKNQLAVARGPSPVPSTAVVPVDKASTLTSKQLDEWLYANESRATATSAEDARQSTTQTSRSLIDDWIYTSSAKPTINEPKKKSSQVENITQSSVDDWLNIAASSSTNNSTSNNKKTSTKEAPKRSSYYFDEK